MEYLYTSHYPHFTSTDLRACYLYNYNDKLNHDDHDHDHLP